MRGLTQKLECLATYPTLYCVILSQIFILAEVQFLNDFFAAMTGFFSGLTHPKYFHGFTYLTALHNVHDFCPITFQFPSALFLTYPAS